MGVLCSSCTVYMATTPDLINTILPNRGSLDVVKENMHGVGAREDEVCARIVNRLIRGNVELK